MPSPFLLGLCCGAICGICATVVYACCVAAGAADHPHAPHMRLAPRVLHDGERE